MFTYLLLEFLGGMALGFGFFTSVAIVYFITSLLKTKREDAQ
ncbi:hypothetical protein [Bacillus sp. EE-W1]|nr:hypothetical protein [Bacillus sp. EE-W1]